jgi:predicted MFS family arabinose efflux permease
MQRLGPRALTLGFLIQVVGFGAVILSVLGATPRSMEIALLVAGLGYGLVVPSVIKAVVGGIDQRHVGLASGMVISTFQIGAALGVAIIGGVFFGWLGTGRELDDYSTAFSVALGCNVVLLVIGGLLSLWLPHRAGPG